MNDPCKTLKAELGSLFECKAIRNLIRIRTPFSYPDGGFLDLFLEDDGSLVSDMGETMRWLNLQTPSNKRTFRQKELISRIVTSNNMSLNGGKISATPKPDFGSTIMRLSQTCMRVSDVFFTFTGKAFSAVLDEVDSFLTENGFETERNKSLIGSSKKQLKIDFEIREKSTDHRSLMKVLSTASGAQTGRMIDHAYRVWGDLSQSKDLPHRNFITLIDDTLGDVWDDGEIGLLSTNSRIVNWSNRNELIDVLSS